jgi:hypothetical protein
MAGGANFLDVTPDTIKDFGSTITRLTTLDVLIPLISRGTGAYSLTNCRKIY